MTTAHMKCIFKELKYPAGQPDVGCTDWSGLIEFAASNGSYAAAHPFIDLKVPLGVTLSVGELIYDGIGGYCGTGIAQLTFRVIDSGLAGVVIGSNIVTFNRPPNQGANPLSINYSVPVLVTNSATGAKATKWFVFTVITMC